MGVKCSVAAIVDASSIRASSDSESILVTFLRQIMLKGYCMVEGSVVIGNRTVSGIKQKLRFSPI